MEKEKNIVEKDISIFSSLGIHTNTKKEIAKYCKDNKISINKLIQKIWKQFKKTGGNIDGSLEDNLLSRYEDFFAFIKEQEKRYHIPIKNTQNRILKLFENNISNFKFETIEENKNIINNNDEILKLKNENALLKNRIDDLENSNNLIISPVQDIITNSNKNNNYDLINKLIKIIVLIDFKDKKIANQIFIPDGLDGMKFENKNWFKSNFLKDCTNLLLEIDIINLIDDYKKSKDYLKYIKNATK